MDNKHKLYPAFIKDLANLISLVPDNQWLTRLQDNAAKDWWSNHEEQKRLVDRIDETLTENMTWRNIRTAYKLRGTKYL